MLNTARTKVVLEFDGEAVERGAKRSAAALASLSGDSAKSSGSSSVAGKRRRKNQKRKGKEK